VGELRAYFRGAGTLAMPRYERGALSPEHSVTGPALVEDEWSTTVVYPGQRCRADRLGNLEIEVGA
jgi:N-methylhydantoinase A